MSQFRVRAVEDPLEREQREIGARRARCDERAKRVLHAKTRLIGVDTLALNSQVNEKQERERLEKERDLYYDDLNSTFAQQLSEAESAKTRQKRSDMMELNHYRKAQEKERRRRDQMERAYADELTEVPTDFLKFGGEDPNSMARTRAQKMQQQDWLAQQIEDIQAREQRDRQEQADYEAMQGRITELQGQQREAAASERARARREVLEYNKQQAAYKRAEAAREAQFNQQQDDEELSNALNGQFLNEAVKIRGGASNFKGFSTEQRQRILDEQKAQMDDIRARRIAEQEDEAAYAMQQEDIRRALLKADREKAAYRKEQLKNLSHERQAQSQEKTMRYDYLDNVVYTNPAQPEFFNQFGRSCR